MSYALRIDTTTIRHWIERGKLIPDHQYSDSRREGFFFRRNRLETIRRDLVRTGKPGTSTEWRQEFLDFAGSRNLTKSYKPVLLQAILRLVDRNGAVPLDNLVREFHAFYLQRDRDGRPAEFGVSLLAAPAAASHEAMKQLVLKYPLDRFIMKAFLDYVAGEGIIRFAPQLWSELRFYDVQDIQNRVEQQLAYYYNRGSAR